MRARTGPARILYTIPNFITAGSGITLLNVLRELDRTAFEPTVCVWRRGGALEAEVEALGIEIIEHPTTVPAMPRGSFLQRARKAAEPFKPYGFDIWHSFHYGDDYSEPVIARLSGAKAWVWTKKNMSWNHSSWWLRTLLSKGVAVQNSTMLRRFFTGPLLSRHVYFTPPGVVMSETEVEPGAGPRARAALGLADDDFVVSLVAHIMPRKAQDIAVKALAKLPDVHLLLLGRATDEDYAASVRALADETGVADRVHWLGNVDNVFEVLAATDVFTLPTGPAAEGCPVALLEAMASALPCVATDVPGPPDVITSGVDGIIIPPLDPDALADAITTLRDDPALRASMGAAAKRRILSNYTIELETRRHEHMYRAALSPVPFSTRTARYRSR